MKVDDVRLRSDFISITKTVKCVSSATKHCTQVAGQTKMKVPHHLVVVVALYFYPEHYLYRSFTYKIRKYLSALVYG